MNALEPEMQKLSDDQLRAKTAEFRARIQERLSSITDAPYAGANVQGANVQGQEEEDQDQDIDRQKEIEAEQAEVLKGVLDELLEAAFAVARGAGRRVLDLR